MKSCPDEQSLQQLLLGKSPKSLTEELEQHLLHCDNCSNRSDTIIASDELTVAIQAPAIDYNEEDEEVLTKAIERAKRLRSQADTAQANETLIARDSQQSESTPNFLVEYADYLAPAEQPDEIGRLGGYRVLQVLGVGGMGVVFRAEDPKLKRQIALKAMKPAIAANQSAKERFIREAQATATIEQDNIVDIFQVGEDRGIPFIAMPFLRGESLRQRLKRELQLDQGESLRFGREIALGLAAAHEHGLIHRDIKPDNIWIEEKIGRAKILDFGLVRSANEDETVLTQAGMVLGTPKYMAPEQAQGMDVDHRCDLFSLGSVLYRLTTGKTPFAGNNATATLIAVVQHQPDSVEKVRPEIGTDFSKLIMQLLEKVPADRPKSASDVAATIAKIEQQLEAKPSSETPSISIITTEEPILASRRKAAAKRQAGGKTRASSSGGISSNRKLLIGGGFVALFLLAALIFRFKTADGTVVVELDGPVEIASIEIDGKEISFTPNGSDKRLTFKVDPGKHQLTIKTSDGLELTTSLAAKPLEIKAGGNLKLRAWVEKATEPKNAPPADLHRAIAERFFALSTRNAVLGLVGVSGTVTRLEDLPKEPFLLSSISGWFGPEFSDADLNFFAQAPNLVALGILAAGPTRLTDAGIEAFSRSTAAKSGKLTSFTIKSGEGITDASISYINSIESILFLAIDGTHISSAGLKQLELPKLRQLNLARMPNFTAKGFAGFGAERPDLGYISVLSCNLQGVDLSSFMHPSLKNLTVGMCQLDDSTLVGLQSTTLESLNLAANPEITDEGASHLTGMPELNGIDLHRSKIGDATCKILLQLPKLKDLNLSQTLITDAGLQTLAKIKTLETLTIKDIPELTEDAVRQLQAALPNCKITSDYGEPE